MQSAVPKDTVSDRDMIDLQCVILKAKVQRVLGIVENVNPKTLQDCLAGVIVPVEVDFNGTQEETSNGVDISATRIGNGSIKGDHGSVKNDHVSANGDQNMMTMKKADKPGKQGTSDEIAKLKTVIRNLRGDIDALEDEKEELEAENGILKENLRRTKALSVIDETLIKEMREFYYGDKEVAPEEEAEMARLKAINVRLIKKLFEVEENQIKLQEEVYDLKMVNQKMVAERLGFSGLPRF
ncbi:uncharacterized protein LOC111701813 isoform X3 [Eurytemora carolleeae]|uniref:uncharacterized protein LOC111701813 isoform X3 n=1 Tax=Eurytemora carolleeae TaxID=1294199 RepID=UPI000C7676EF|nr:uncharacterized protein LOC111701813 isoform X3 [Eurytemora carolleeae]|eukprot:XP_023329013.1 uncharacterized protein LOC111701813 isoform X3 [Eurytemora affinis]